MWAFLKSTFLVLLGFLLVAVFVWYAGPYFGFGEYHPLEPEIARLVALAVIVGCWLVARLLRRLRAFRASGQLLAAVVAQRQPEPAQPSAEAVKLRERFEEAVGALQQERRGGHSLYDLPWYVIIGAPGSGKTTALLNSGLKFPLEQRMGKGALRGVGGTRNCDWWFTDEAVFLDTAGRYTTQDSDAASDSAGWAEFLSLLRKYRARRPVNGVILTINAQDLLVLGEAAREVHVEAARRRLNELNRELRVQLPVYLMVTKCDLVAGFTEYFEDLTPEGRAQVWGVTFPYEQTLSNEATRVFPEEFDALMARLNARVFARVEDVRDVRRRTRAFAFPQQMASLRDALAQFVGEVFASTRFDQQILLRGVYFTSGTQDGTPVDRLLGTMVRRLGMAPEALAPPSGPGKAYFVEWLLRDVLIGESGLAGLSLRVEVRKAAAQLGAYAAMGLVAALGVVLLSVSYGRNRDYLAQTMTDLAALRQVPPATAGASLEGIVPRLNAVSDVVVSADRYREDTPWAMRWGLNQGRSVGNAARDAYVRELDGLLLPRVAALLRDRLVASATDPQKLFDYLKAYLMLGDPKRLDTKYLQSLVESELKDRGGRAAGADPKLTGHFRRLLEYEPTLRPIALDRTLVAQARSSIRQASIPKIMYSAIKREHADDRSVLSVVTKAGVGAEQVFRYKSGRSLSEVIPALYTKEVFSQVTGIRESGKLAKTLEGDAWVWNEGGASLADVAQIRGALNDLYEKDYIEVWDKMLNDLEFVPLSTIGQTNDALGILVASTSPLRGLVTFVTENTLIVEQSAKPTEAPGAVSAAKKAIVDKVQGLAKDLQQAAGVSIKPAGAQITAAFRGIHQLQAGEPGKAPIDGILGLIGEIRQAFVSPIGSDIAGADAKNIINQPALRELLNRLRAQADPLPPGLRTLVAEIGNRSVGVIGSTAGEQITKQYEQEVVAQCRAAGVDQRYPFVANGPDMSVADFGRVFGSDGVFEKFFKENLAGQVNDDWTLRSGAVVTQRMVDHFRNAGRLREMFFPAGSKTPTLSLLVTPGFLDPSAKRFVLEFGGQRADIRLPGPRATQMKVDWPGSGGDIVGTFESVFPPEADRYQGAWAWFHMIDKGAPTWPDSQHVVFGFGTAFNRAQVTVEAPSPATNPFTERHEWRNFRCTS